MVQVTKACRKCGERKPFPDAFDRNRRTPGGYGDCKQCNAARAMQAFYRLSWSDYLAMRRAQFDMCAICVKPLGEVRREVAIDHDHSCDHPGKGVYSCRACVRGLLCQHCNRVILPIVENRELMAAAVRYLGARGAEIVSDLIDAMHV